MFESFRKDSGGDTEELFRKIAERNKKIGEELGNPETEKKSQEFFALSRAHIGLGIYDRDNSEYPQLAARLEEMKREFGDELALYTTRKFVLVRERGLPWAEKNQYVHHFLHPEYLEKIGSKLTDAEIRSLLRYIEGDLIENLSLIAERRALVKAYGFEKGKDFPRWVENVQRDRENLLCLLSYSTDEGKEYTERLIRESEIPA